MLPWLIHKGIQGSHKSSAMADAAETERLLELQAEAAGIAAKIAQREAAEAAAKAKAAAAYADQLLRPLGKGKGSPGPKPPAPKSKEAAAATVPGKLPQASKPPTPESAATKAPAGKATGKAAGTKIAALLSGPPVAVRAPMKMLPRQPDQPPPKRLRPPQPEILDEEEAEEQEERPAKKAKVDLEAKQDLGGYNNFMRGFMFFILLICLFLSFWV